MKIFSGIAEKVILTRWVNFDDYLDLRAQFLDIYENCAEMEPLQEHYKENCVQDLQARARDAGKEAKNFEPHSTVFNPLNNFKKVFRMVQIIVAVFGLALWAFGFVTVDFLSRVISIPSVAEVLINYIPATWVVFGFVYLEILRRDSQFLRKMNEKLKIDQDEIEQEVERSKLISYILWNRGLTKNTTIPVLAFISVVRGVRRGVVDDGMRFANLMLVYHLKEDMTQIEALGAAYARLYHENIN